jgi:methionyl-tRNA formyltransferase
MNTRIVFMGSPDFAVPALESLANHFSVVGIVTQPDRPAGRGRKLTPPPIKTSALDLGIPTIQPQRLRNDQAAQQQIQEWEPNVIVVAAYGQILKTNILQAAPFGCVNIHASLLPRWRGVSPIQAAIINGDRETGVTIMKMDEGIDTGDILKQESIPIGPHDTGGTIFDKLSHLGASLIVETLPAYLSGNISPIPQGESPTPYAPMLSRSDGELDFNQSAKKLALQVRAYNPWPGTYMFWRKSRLKIYKAQAISIQSPGSGIACLYQKYPAVGTTQGVLQLVDLQPAGKKRMFGDQFLRGVQDWA